MSERTIEVCTNSEWLGLGAELYQDEAGSDWFSQVVRKLDDAFGCGVAIPAQGQRTMYHGWNGANTFTRKGSGLGTFCEFTDSEWECACDIANRCYVEVEAYWQDQIDCEDAIEDAIFAAEQSG